MAHSIGSCLTDLAMCGSRGAFYEHRVPPAPGESRISARTHHQPRGRTLTSSLTAPYLDSCRHMADRNGVGVRAVDSSRQRRMFGVRNLIEREKTGLKKQKQNHQQAEVCTGRRM